MRMEENRRRASSTAQRGTGSEEADAPWLSDLLDGSFQQKVIRHDTVTEKVKKVRRPPGSARPVGPAQAAASVAVSAALY